MPHVNDSPNGTYHNGFSPGTLTPPYEEKCTSVDGVMSLLPPNPIAPGTRKGRLDSIEAYEHAKKSPSWSEKDEEIIKAPYDYLMSHPGKDVRRKVMTAFNVWLGIDHESYSIVERTITMLHNASLLIDDIQDNSPLRRGSPVANSVFGIAQTINSANYVYFQAQKELFGLSETPAALQVFNEELLNLHRGQGMDLYWRDSLTVPTDDEYLEMASNKTGGLFRLAIRLMQTVSSTSYDLVPLANIIGIMFQIQDDYKNLASEKVRALGSATKPLTISSTEIIEQMSAAKGCCDDIEEGKFSFPIIHAIRNSPSNNNVIINILKSRTKDKALKMHAVDYMRDVTRSLDYTKNILNCLQAQAKGMIGSIEGGNSLLEKILDCLLLD